MVKKGHVLYNYTLKVTKHLGHLFYPSTTSRLVCKEIRLKTLKNRTTNIPFLQLTDTHTAQLEKE